MYSPPTGGAARRPSATIDKNQTSNRRFIICGEKDYLRGYDIAQAVAVIGEYCGGTAKSWRMEPPRPRAAPRGKQTARGGPSPGRFLPICIHFAAQQIFPRLPLPDQRKLIAADERFCREQTRIVVRRHHESVRARAHDREQIAFMRFRHLAVERKKIAGLTHRPNNVDPANLPLPLTVHLFDRHNFVIALV